MALTVQMVFKRLAKEEGVVLHALRYDDSRLVVKIYTRCQGLRSYMVRPSRRNGNGSGAGVVMFQPLTHLTFESVAAKGNAMESLRNVSLAGSPLLAAPGPMRSSVALFVADVLNQTIRHPEADPALFEFVVTVVGQVMNAPDDLLNDIPLIFMMQQARLLGFEPLLNRDRLHPLFDMMEGRFVSTAIHGHYVPADWSELFIRLAKECRSGFGPLSLPRHSRRVLLSFLIEYFALQVPGMGEIKSHRVLHEVLSG